MSGLTTFGAFTAARLGIYASMRGLQVTGNNIANINTTGYTRQVLDQISLRTGGHDRYQSPYEVNIGSGVLCTGVSQIRDPYLDIRYRSEQSTVGSLDARMSVLEELESILDEVGKGEDEGGVLEAQFNDLISQLQMLSKNVGSGSSDGLVRSSAETLVNLLHTYAGRLDTIKEGTVTDFKQDISTVNGILTNIRDMNESIRNSEIHGDNALELRDERNRMLDELSYYMKVDVTYERESTGGGDTVERLVIKLAGTGQNNDTEKSTLVSGVYAAQLSINQVPQANPDYDKNDPASLPYLDADGNPTGDPDAARQVDDPNFNLVLDALKDVKDRVMVKGKSRRDTLGSFDTLEEANELLATLTGSSTTAPNGDITNVTYAVKKRVETVTDTTDPDHPQEVEKTFYDLVQTTKTVSGQVELGDNDLYGSLQAIREMLTEAGEFTDKLVIEGDPANGIAPVDPGAAIKRGIPYYQKTLDALAGKFAEIMNGANAERAVGLETEIIGGREYYKLAAGSTALTLDERLVGETMTQKQKDALLPQPDGGGEGVYIKGGGTLISTGSGSNNGAGVTASNISIAKDWASGATQILASAEFNAPSTKNDNIIHLITLLDSTKFDYRAGDVEGNAFEGNQVYFNGTIQEMLAKICATRADDARVTGTLLDVASATATERDTNRDSVSGVDLNDEAANLMMYQKTYAAACRMMTTIDEALDKLINGTGVVGR